MFLCVIICRNDCVYTYTLKQKPLEYGSHVEVEQWGEMYPAVPSTRTDYHIARHCQISSVESVHLLSIYMQGKHVTCNPNLTRRGD